MACDPAPNAHSPGCGGEAVAFDGANDRACPGCRLCGILRGMAGLAGLRSRIEGRPPSAANNAGQKPGER